MIYFRINQIMTNVERFTLHSGQEWLKTFVDTLVSVISPYVKNKVILDAGCGSGYPAYTWLQQGALHIDAYDISDETLSQARKDFPDNRIHFEKKDFNTASFKKNYYDICVSMEVIEHLQNYEFHLKQIHSALKKEGLLFITTPNAAVSEGKNEFHIKEFTYEELKQLVNTIGFTVIKYTGISKSNISHITGLLTPRFIINLAKRMPFYDKVMQLFFKPSISNALSAETMILICKKN